MRGPMRGEQFKGTYVSLRRIRELVGVRAGTTVRIGALATHADLAHLAAGAGPLGSIAEAARRSAFPAIRHVATIGGNLRARPFPEADLVPALLSLDAALEVISGAGRSELGLEDYLASRDERPVDEIIVAVHIPAPLAQRSCFERVTVRGGGEYAVATLAVALTEDADGRVANARIAVGSVEATARRARPAEDVVRGELLSRDVVEAAAAALTEDVSPRDGRDAPAWYRRRLLPGLLRRSVAHLADSTAGV
jgi:aerobic carbon-monoxide dehydrogenase medium subunit